MTASTPTPPRRILVVGGGLSGLSLAYRVRSLMPNAHVQVLESASRPGGNVWTERHDGFTLELGPNGFLDSKPSTIDLCQSLGVREQLIPASEGSRKNRFLFLNGRLHRLPGTLLGLLRTSLLSPATKMHLFTEPLRARPHHLPDEESVAAFARRRFGREVAETFIDALVTGIHGGDPEKLSVEAAFPRLPKFERDHGSVIRGFLRTAKERRRKAAAAGLPKPGPQKMWSFAGGLRVLVESLAEKVDVQTNVYVRTLQRVGEEWQLRGEGREEWRADTVALTCPAAQQAEILSELDSPLADEIATIGYTPITVVLIAYPRSDVPHDLDGFGYIAPQRTRRDALGVQWCSSIFPERAPPGLVLWRVLCGGVNRPDVMSWDDETVLRKVHQELGITMKVRGQPVFHRIVRWPRAIPQYLIGHVERVRRIEALAARHTGLVLGGNAYRGIAMNDCTEQGELLAQRIAQS